MRNRKPRKNRTRLVSIGNLANSELWAFSEASVVVHSIEVHVFGMLLAEGNGHGPTD